MVKRAEECFVIIFYPAAATTYDPILYCIQDKANFAPVF